MQLVRYGMEGSTEKIKRWHSATGAYGFPVERASKIAVGEIRSFLGRNCSIKKVVVVCYSQLVFDCYLESLLM